MLPEGTYFGKGSQEGLCAAIENQPGRFGEICTVVGLTSKGNKSA